MEFKGTKGKWFKPNGTTIIQSDNGSEICDYAGYKTTLEEDEANALLISKAPEMLEMLNKLYAEDLLKDYQDDVLKLIKEATELS